jgi:hypothetical protein
MSIMSLKIGLVLAIVAPTVILLIVGAAGRIRRLLFGDEHAEHGSRTSSGNYLRSTRSVSADVSPSTLARRSGVGHY